MAGERAKARRLAVIGGSGFLGAWVVSLARRDATLALASLSRDPSRYPRPQRGERVEAIEVDALEGRELEHALAAWKPTHVILCAALSRMAECASDPERAHLMNARLPQRVALACRGGAHLTLVSTDLVFGGSPPPRGGFDERARPAPVSDYGRSKLAGEAALRELAGERAGREAGARLTIVRLPLLYGPSLDRGLGASDSLLAAVARGERPLLFTDERRTPLDVRDAAAALLELTLAEAGGLWHVGGPVALDRHAFAMAVLLEQGLPVDVARSKLLAGLRRDAGLERERPADVSLDSSHARARLRTRLRGPSEALADRSG